MTSGILRPELRTRVVVIFVLAVLLPCLFFGYLGLKSIKQEKQWQQELVRQNLASSLSRTVASIEGKLDEQIRNSLREFIAPPSGLTPAYLSSLRGLVTHSSVAQAIFLIDRNDRLVYPKTFRDPKSAELREPRSTRLHEFSQLYEGDALEAQGRIEEALKEYQAGLSVSLPASVQCAYVVRIARCEFKKGNYESAARMYHRLLALDQNRFYGEGMPYALIARLQLLEMAEKKSPASTLAGELVDFHRMLVDHYDQIDRAQYTFCLNQINSRLENARNMLQKVQWGKIDSLVAVEKQIGQEQQFRDLVQNSLLPQVMQSLGPSDRARLPLSQTLAGHDIRYVPATVDSSRYLLALHVTEEAKSPVRVLGVVLRKEPLTDVAHYAVRQTSDGEDVRPALLGAGDAMIYPTNIAEPTVVLTQPFAVFEPLAGGMRMAMVASGKNPLEEISARSLNIYYVLLGSVILLLAGGIVLILRDISREEKTSSMKSEFIANVSHEIKTPIATIRTLAENLTEGWVGSEAERREFYRLIERESVRLSHLVGNILDFSRMERGKNVYHMSTVSVGDATKKALERFRLLVDGQGVTIKDEIDGRLPFCHLDAEAFEQAVLNLLDNAVKYSREDKTVTISARVESEMIKVSVTDQGIGIDKKDTQRIFDKFYRSALPGGLKIPGSGIGLTLVQEIVEAHGGSVVVESELGKGSTFTISLPLANGTQGQMSDQD